METPSANELKLIRELVSEGYISLAQAKQILEQWKKTSNDENPISLGILLSESGFIANDVLLNYLKTTFPNENSLSKINPPIKNLVKDEFKNSEEIFDQIKNHATHKLIGNGNIGSSYLVESKEFDKKVIKLLNTKLQENIGYLNSVKKGLEIIDFKNHPSLLPHQYNETANGKVYFVSTYIVNDSIGSFIKQNGKLEVNSGLEIIKKICDILKFFERIKCPHLGLHPENIFKDFDGSIFLKDFEWNRKYFKNLDDRIAFGPGICYMSPEYIKGTNIDHTTDIYSLGILLYFFLTRRLPFHGSVEVQLLKKEKLEYVDISEVHKNIPLYIGDLINRMIDPNKAVRFQSFEELSTDLDEILKKRYLNEATKRKPSPVQNSMASDSKLSPLGTIDTSITNSQESVTKAKKANIKYLILFVFVIGFFFLAQFAFELTVRKPEIAPIINKQPKVEIDNFKKKNITLVEDNKLNFTEELPIQEKVKREENLKEVQNKIQNEILQKIDLSKDKKKFSKRLNAIRVIQENLKGDSEISKDTVNRLIAEEQEKIDNERQLYWEEKKSILKDLFAGKNKENLLKVIESINEETENDESIKNKIFQLRVEIQRLDPEESKNFTLENESIALKESIEKKSISLLENHDYASLLELLSNAIQKEKNVNQKQVYAEQLEFYEHADKVKKISQDIAVKPNILLRSLLLDVDGDLEAVSSKGFHVKNSNNKIIPWKDISSKALAALVAKYEPNSLGESISLLIYASRAGNHIAMQKALRTIESKYGASVNTPLVKESQEKLKELKDYLEEDAIKWQLGLIKTLKSRNTLKAKKDAEALINELKDEYLSNPIYKKYETEIIDITAALDQIK